MRLNDCNDPRMPLPIGALISMPQGVYCITGEPVGFGGSGIIYPAKQVWKEKGSFRYSKIEFAIKECYPLSYLFQFYREQNGTIKPVKDDQQSTVYLSKIQSMQYAEYTISCALYQTNYRIDPIWTIGKSNQIAMDGLNFHAAYNIYAVMERLDRKGCSLREYSSSFKEHRVGVRNSLLLVKQVLLALREVHRSGYLHCDIQDGNIFLKGTDPVTGENGILSLIDFGAARALKEDGKSEVIADKCIFATDGFNAPEMIQKNDGTLRLAPSCDLYSAGYLLLTLLTGQYYHMQALQLMQQKHYLSRYRARQINCPDRLLAGLNHVLSKSLEANPEQRYQSAQEMIDDLEVLINAITPVKNNLEVVEYAAFISYRHSRMESEPDSMVAIKLHQSLERFWIPASVRTEKHQKRIGRIFRDSAELCAAVDIDVYLRAVLKQTPYLIVICSPRTPESQWVRHEIELFLKFHHRDHILPVLVEGEPEESIPACIYDASTGAQSNAVEVLAADLRCTSRKPTGKQLKTESMRLLSSMLGCTFDELYRRKREYTYRRSVALSTAIIFFMSIFTGFSFYQNEQIKTRNEEMLVNQSRYLAQVSGQLLESGDRTRALQVAMAALPKSEDDRSRPVVTEAVYALNSALYTYDYPAQTGVLPDQTIDLTNSVDADSAVLSPDGLHLCCIDQKGVVQIAALDRNCITQTISADQLGADAGEPFIGVSYADESTLLLLTGNTLYCWNIKTQNLFWNYTDKNDWINSNTAVAISGDRTTAAVLNDWSIWFIRISDGFLLHRVEISDKINYNFLMNHTQFILSDDGTQAAIGCASTSESEKSKFALVNQDGTIQPISAKNQDVEGLLFLDDSLVCVSMKYNQAWAYRTCDCTWNISAYRCADGSEIWSQDGIGTMEEPGKVLLSVGTAAMLQGEQQPQLFCCINRQFMMLAPDSGALRVQLNCEDSILCLYEVFGSNIHLAFSNGTTAWKVLEQESSEITDKRVQYSCNRILYSESTKTLCQISSDSSKIVLCRQPKQIGYTSLAEQNSTEEFSLYGMLSGAEDGYIFARLYDMQNETDYRLILYRFENHEQVYTSEDDTAQFAGMLPYASGDILLIESANTETGETILSAYQLNSGDLLWKHHFENEFYLQTVGTQIYIVSDRMLHMIDGLTGEMVLCPSDYELNLRFCVADNGQKLLFYTSASNFIDEMIAIYDVPSKTWKLVTEQNAQLFTIAAGQQGALFAFANPNGYPVVSNSVTGGVVEQIPIACQPYYGILFLEQDRYLLFCQMNGRLCTWDLQEHCIAWEDSCAVASSAYLYGYKAAPYFSVTSEFGNLSHIYYVNKDGSFMRYFDMNGGNFIPEYQCVLWAGYLYGDTDYGYYKLLSLDDLLAEADAVLDGRKMSVEDKRKYYIPESS